MPSLTRRVSRPWQRPPPGRPEPTGRRPLRAGPPDHARPRLVSLVQPARLSRLPRSSQGKRGCVVFFDSVPRAVQWGFQRVGARNGIGGEKEGSMEEAAAVAVSLSRYLFQ
ncbi:hypothetical protein NDU88_001940 [Pleurodeles waltl]|uniref:Uncharacterized protein n=1 Tax=Pleurodeles waltl TaxID=8319 RepID=A0AAV7WNT1_PLEWA|nr:hypothetical protein NDU88_001940 [Pleurodeles waltl]